MNYYRTVSGVTLREETEVLGGRNCPSANLFSTNPT